MSEATHASVSDRQGRNTGTSPDGLYETMKNARRRAVLRYLLYEENPTTFRDLVEYVAAQENDTDTASVTAAQRNRVRTALYQHHLDKLDEHHLVDYDKREGTVRLNGNAAKVRAYLEPADYWRRDVTDYAIGLLILAVALVGIWFPVTVTGSLIAVGILGFLLVVHTFKRTAGTVTSG